MKLEKSRNWIIQRKTCVHRTHKKETPAAHIHSGQNVTGSVCKRSPWKGLEHRANEGSSYRAEPARRRLCLRSAHLLTQHFFRPQAVQYY